MSEKEKMKEIIIPDIEILDDTPEEVKTDYFFRLMAKNQVDKFNTKLDLKVIEKEIKDLKDKLSVDGVTASDLKKAYEYLFPKTKGERPTSPIEEEKVVNKKMLEAERIEFCMNQIRLMLSGKDNEFLGVDKRIIEKISILEEIDEGIKNVQDKIGEYGLDKKAISKMVENEIKEQDPNKKPQKDTLLLDEAIEKYDDMLVETKRDIYPLPLTKIEL